MEDRPTLWVRPLGVDPPPPGVTYASARTFHAYDRFARTLGEAMGRAIEVIERPSQEASGAGLFLMDLDLQLTLELAERAAKGLHDPARVFLLNGSRADAMAAVEQGSALGAVLRDRYFHWQHQHEQRARADVFGAKSLAAALAPHLVPGGLLETEHGIEYVSDPSLSLPAAVALYLATCACRGCR